MAEEDNPFSDATIIRPNPGGRLRPAAPAADPAAPVLSPIAASPAPANPALLNTSTGLGPLVDAASTILSLVSRLATTISQQDVEGLRRRVRDAFGEFEKRAAATGLRPEILGACHYALCATVDDVASNMPWGSHNVWADQSMARVFHNDTSGGERFFDLLQHFERDPETHFEVLELFYFCLSLGFQGRFRLLSQGASDLATTRARLYRIIRRRRGDVPVELSPHWRGIAAPHRPLTAFLPLWAIGAGVALALLVIFIVLYTWLGRSTGELYTKLAGLPDVEKPQIEGWSKPLPPPPPPPPKVAPQLKPEIQSSCVTVDEGVQTITVRLHCTGLFAPGSAALDDRFGPTVDDIAKALKAVPGTLTVVGHTDNQPIHNLRFPSNFELSLARAQTVRDRLVKDGISADQIKVDGKGEKEPVADNNTLEGREANRRIEFILLRSAEKT
jgi:type VI secretion system protein ImpK